MLTIISHQTDIYQHGEVCIAIQVLLTGNVSGYDCNYDFLKGNEMLCKVFIARINGISQTLLSRANILYSIHGTHFISLMHYLEMKPTTLV